MPLFSFFFFFFYTCFWPYPLDWSLQNNLPLSLPIVVGLSVVVVFLFFVTFIHRPRERGKRIIIRNTTTTREMTTVVTHRREKCAPPLHRLWRCLSFLSLLLLPCVFNFIVFFIDWLVFGFPLCAHSLMEKNPDVILKSLVKTYAKVFLSSVWLHRRTIGILFTYSIDGSLLLLLF